MAAILPGYEYDIFISYRQNDNKRDGWVTNFVEALKDELEATLKNPVSIYFDVNPHDGLLESHQVGASLEKKLKCLVFIPIVSQTYCDTESFAWKHEFLPFNKMAHEDELGMNITLAGGNVASRVLPIKIHDIDAEDQQMVEKELGGIMRAIDFIYKEAGVNRPLKPSDDRNLNLEKTDYHNQINKVANALKEIGKSLVKSSQTDEPERPSAKRETSPVRNTKEKKSKTLSLKLILGVLFIPLIILAAYYSYQNYYTQENSAESLDKSIAVLPFRNDSNDPSNIYFCNGLMEDIINQLAQIPDMRVPSATSMLYYRDNPKPYEEIIKELNVSYLLEASVRKMTGKAILNITLIDAEQNEQIWSDRIEMDLSVKDLFDVQFDVADAVANKMRIAMDDSKIEIPTSSYQAYDNFIKARGLIKFWDLGKNRQALDLLLAAVKLDSQFLNAFVYLGQSYGQRAELSDGGSWLDSAQHYSAKAYEMDRHDAGAINALGYANVLAGNNLKGLDLYLQAEKINPNTPYNYAGWCYHRLGEFDEAILWTIKNIKDDPNNTIYYVDMGNACNALGLFDYTKDYCDRALEINADNSFIYDNLWEMEFRKGNYKEAIEYSNHAYKMTKQLKYQAYEGIFYYKMDSLEKASARFSNNFSETFDEELDDENSKIEIYELMQYQFLTMIKLGQKKEGLKKLAALVHTIERSISVERAEKYYLLAGCHATLGNIEKSIGYLETLIDKEYYNYYTFINSSLLDPLHNNADYKRIISIVKERNDKMREKVLKAGYLTK